MFDFLLHFQSTGKDGKIAIFRLVDFEGESNEEVIRGRTEFKDHTLEKTKGYFFSYIHF